MDKKIVAATLLVLGAAGFCWMRYRHSTATPPVTTMAAAEEFRPGRSGPPSTAERNQFREQMLSDVGATPEQRVKLAEIEKQYEGKTGPEAFRGRFEALSQVLTPEQQQKAREAGMNRMRQRMNERLKVLPPEERAKFLKKLDDRRNLGGRGFGPGGPWGRPGGPGRGGAPGSRPSR